MNTIKLNLYINKVEITRQMRKKGYTNREISCLSSVHGFARWFAHKNHKQMPSDHIWSKEGAFNTFLCKDEYINTGISKEIKI